MLSCSAAVQCGQTHSLSLDDSYLKTLLKTFKILCLSQNICFSAHIIIFISWTCLCVETSHILSSLMMSFSCLVKTLYLLTSLQCCLCAEVLIFWILWILELSCFHLPISRFPSLSEWDKKVSTQGFCFISLCYMVTTISPALCSKFCAHQYVEGQVQVLLRFWLARHQVEYAKTVRSAPESSWTNK